MPTPALTDPKLPYNTNYCKCAACGEYFGGGNNFEKHRVGKGEDRSCLPQSALAGIGLSLNRKGYWVREYKDRS